MAEPLSNPRPARSGFAFLLLILVVLVTGSCHFPLHRKTNQKDDQGRRTGRWINYWNDSLKIKMYDGYFREDRETRTCRFYHYNGKISARFRYGRNHIKVKFWEPDGRVIQKGRSILILTSDSVAYYYHGKWKFYDGDEKLVRESVFTKGRETLLLKERDSAGRLIRHRPPLRID